MKRTVAILGMAIGLTGCMRPPAYQQPASPVPNAWPASAGVEGRGEPLMPWQEFFTDERLQAVIQLALANNRDLRMAALNVERVQAQYRIQSAAQNPAVAGSLGGNTYRIPVNTRIGAIAFGDAVTFAQYSANLGVASWELDLFGRIRSLKSAALEQFLASREARSAAQIALVSAVANTWLALAADRENLQLANDVFKAQMSFYELIRQTRDAGLASDLDVRQAESQVETARADIAQFSGRVAMNENALTLLAGTPVPDALLPAGLFPDGALKEIRAGLPSEVLLVRPDILAAEHELKSANANIGAARAAFFPRIALTAGLGLLSSDLTNLFKTGSGSWSFAPQVGLPIFDSGARRASVQVAQTQRDMAIAEYEKTIQSAFREVSDSLILRTRLAEQERAAAALVRSLEETYRLSEARYKAGIDSYLNVLVAQRALYSSQQGMVLLRLAKQSNLVTLYKVLGGGA